MPNANANPNAMFKRKTVTTETNSVIVERDTIINSLNTAGANIPEDAKMRTTKNGLEFSWQTQNETEE